ncbi:hypothetical protein SELMODRAFT_118685 [Selaginella moellendorffii]|uniref:UDP-glycosyltransferases domain-containing protein n=2 Tax=Selaginella moellendorffii TaxID=88036 RepID=D8SJU6_SELML|nr:hypothetical protein SELMODRAFT_118685 [Selaginella moellendorffii]
MDPESALRELLADLLASPSPPVCLVADFSLPWTAAPARDLDLARYVLYTDPANFMAVAYFCKKLVEMAILPAKDPREKKIAVPGVPDLSQHDISQYIWDSRDQYHPRVELWHRKTVESDGVLLNTFYELESSAVDALREEILPGTSLFTVGPLIVTGFSGSESDSRCAVYGAEKNACMEWLDSKPESSVLYVSFGSWEVLVDDQITELAQALESSGCFFLWVVRLAPGSSIGSLLPQGFESRVIAPGRGLIVTTWAPQQEILKHQATGGFVTHCGWNSVLECVCLAGVPMVCWPLISDQPTTCRFVVDGLRIGVEIHEDASGFVDRGEIENAVKMVMVEGAEMRRIAGEYKRLAAIAASEEGSSSISLREFMDKALKGRSYVPCNSGNST